MRVLSLFDGMSCGQIALSRVGINVDKYYASEINKYAIQVTMKNYPDTIQLGDVSQVKGMDIDLLMGGSPCQGFSFVGKQLNFEDPRSRLFFEFVRLLRESKPKYFLLENVKMKQSYQDVISSYIGVDPVEINSALVSAHNRPRLYWTNIKFDKNIKDRCIGIKEILEKDCTEIEDFKECVRKNIIGVDIHKHLWPAGYAQIPSKSGWSDHKIGITKSPCLRAGNTFTLVECKSGGVRKLTITEWERLQTVPDGYTVGVSRTQRHKMLGNGWTVEVLAHIFRGLR